MYMYSLRDIRVPPQMNWLLEVCKKAIQGLEFLTATLPLTMRGPSFNGDRVPHSESRNCVDPRRGKTVNSSRMDAIPITTISIDGMPTDQLGKSIL